MRLDGYVQRRGRFVGDQQFRFAGNRHGNRDTLAHTAGQLMRVGVHTAGGTRDFNFFQQFDGALAGSLAGHFQVQAQHFFNLETDGVARVQGSHRILEDHGQVFTHDLATLAIVELEHVLAVEIQGVSGDDPRMLDQAHQRHHGHGLAGTGLANDGQHFALVHLQVETIDDWRGVFVAEANVEILDF
ncbi:hypothetical protein D3C81_1365250 [compost metagenome]